MTDTDPGDALDCGKTIEEISDYLAHERVPYDAAIETCPECMHVLDALQRVSQLSRQLVADDARRLPPPPDSWFDSIIDNIRTEMRAGRRLPIHHSDPRVTLVITEGAVRSLLRTVGDRIPGVIIGSCRITGDPETVGAPVSVDLTASVAAGTPIPPLVARLRGDVAAALHHHTELSATAINITIQDLHANLGEDPT